MKIKLKQILELYCKITCSVGTCECPCAGREDLERALKVYKITAKTTPKPSVSVYGTSCIAWDNVLGKYNLACCPQCSVRQYCIYYSHPEFCKLTVTSK
jgi:hypothetical protein